MGIIITCIYCYKENVLRGALYCSFNFMHGYFKWETFADRSFREFRECLYREIF